ncbi:serine/threonine-protein kinase ATM-like [Teleopsis dalmanni]|uniref:serine/threonine-protein kinase ATM-like n=1 Tax=Teleopsis dalmanni TaxID=139649 RepID=UPI0018CC8413|nr:serine/threonine-protein kinase ATM-like [Teleopsis dalmanni]
MAGVYDLSAVCAECNSDKVAVRNKAIERLNGLLVSHKEDVFLLLKNDYHRKDICWKVMFESAINATIKHSVCLDDIRLTKGTQNLQNKNYFYRSVVNKILDYNVEENFLTKSAIFTAFIQGFENHSTIKHFGALFLNLLDRGLYKSLMYVQDIKLNEFSRILSYLFEVNVENEVLRFAILQTIIKTIEIGTQNVVLNFDLIGYLPEIYVYAHKASDDRKKFDVLRLFYIFVINLSIDYHFTIGTDLQKLIPVLCGYYFTLMKSEAKELFFKSVYKFLKYLYPNICNGDNSTFPITLNENWSKTLKKLMSIVDMEIKANRLQQDQIDSDVCAQSFINVASLIIYLLQWNIIEDDMVQSKSKIPKLSDPLEIVLNFVRENSASNEIWFCILSTLISNYNCVLNSTNYVDVLTTVLLMYEERTTRNILYIINTCIRALLKFELHYEMCHVVKKSIEQLWKKFTDLLVSEISNGSEIIIEKQKLLQTVIPYGKMSKNQCEALIQSFTTINTMRRNECIITVRSILDNSNICGIDKGSDICVSILTWLYDTNTISSDVRSLIRNVKSIDTELISDTAASAVINFLEKKSYNESDHIVDYHTHFDILQYKYLRKCVFINKNEKQIQLFNEESLMISKAVLSNCLFQKNYGVLLEILDLEKSKNSTINDILYDLNCLYKISSVMKFLLQYKAFNNDNYTQCPLTKRILVFLNHIENAVVQDRKQRILVQERKLRPIWRTY